MNVIQWLARQLFGSKAGNAYAAEVQSLIQAFVALNPNASLEAVEEYVHTKSAGTVSKVLGALKLPGWASSAIEAYLVSQEDALVKSIYVKVVGNAAPVGS